VNNEKCLFLTQEKTTITNFSAKINYTKTPINANPMIANRHLEKTIKCKNAMPFEKKNCKKILEIHKKV
jgi:hypothetical protein